MAQPDWPTLDDLTFQAIVDRLKQQIAIYCPEWTDHNVSDPGVTMIELFASMAEMMLYRVNRLPEHAYRAFLDLIGARLDPARPAVTDVTFYLTGAPVQKRETVPIERGTEVSTPRTATSAPIVFSTSARLEIVPVTLKGVYRYALNNKQAMTWQPAELDREGRAGSEFAVFAEPDTTPAENNGLYFELGADHGMHVLAVSADCKRAVGGGARVDDPPWSWEVSGPDGATWQPCIVERDETGGFNREGAGDIVLRLPAMGLGHSPSGDPPQAAYWLRCRLDKRQGQATAASKYLGYQKSPVVLSLSLRAIGGTAPAQQATVIRDERLGVSDGTPYQAFRLQHTPLLARDGDEEFLVVQTPTGAAERWCEVGHFADAGPADPYYTIDHAGALRFGPLLAQPNGKFMAFGRIPPKGSELRFARYRSGGGVAGNVPAGALSVRRSADARVARVTNWLAAVGGRDAQTVADARMRAPAYLQTRTRAVTAEDYLALAAAIEGVQSVACLSPAQAAQLRAKRPGLAAGVVLAILPELRQPAPLGPFPPELEAQSGDPFFKQVEARLAPRSLVGVPLTALAPGYVRVQVLAELNCEPGQTEERRNAIKQHALDELYRYLDPHSGGPERKGWLFGRRLSDGMVKRVLQDLPGVESVEQVLLIRVELQGSSRTLGPASLLIDLLPHELICSDAHEVVVQHG